MAWTKRALVEQAFNEIALAGYVFDITPEELQACLNRLESMMATWSAQGLTLPYAFADDGSLDASSGLPMVATEAVYLALAQRTAASKGKALPASLNVSAREAKNALLSWLAHQDLQEQQLPNGTPRGAGQKSWRGTQRPFFDVPDTNPLQPSDNGGLSILGG